MVTWTKLPSLGESSMAKPSVARYFVTSSLNDWSMQEMKPDDTCNGRVTLDVTMRRQTEDFYIVRDEDWGQVFYRSADASAASDQVLGPDDPDDGLCWNISGNIGDNMRIEFHRRYADGCD